MLLFFFPTGRAQPSPAPSASVFSYYCTLLSFYLSCPCRGVISPPRPEKPPTLQLHTVFFSCKKNHNPTLCSMPRALGTCTLTMLPSPPRAYKNPGASKFAPQQSRGAKSHHASGSATNCSCRRRRRRRFNLLLYPPHNQKVWTPRARPCSHAWNDSPDVAGLCQPPQSPP